MLYEIKKEEWKICKICGRNIKEIRKDFNEKNLYYSQVFLLHLKEHNIKLIRFWEKDIKENPNKIKGKIKCILKELSQ